MPVTPIPATPIPGTMDNPYYDWSPISTRPALRWPDGARIAVAVVLCLEHLDWYPPPGTIVPPSLRGAGPEGYPNVVDLHTISQYEYGNRVGVFRVGEVLRENGLSPTVAMDGSIIKRAPFLVEYLSELGAEFIGHGVSADRLITSEMDEDDERSQIAQTIETISLATGEAPRGWMGSEYSESTRTVALLAEHGLDYVLDWPTDEQPHPMKVPSGVMTNLPIQAELDDVVTHVGRLIPVQRYTQMITEQFDRLHADGAVTGRAFVLTIHPWVMGQPFRIRHLASAIRHIAEAPEVWLTTGAKMVDAYRAQA